MSSHTFTFQNTTLTARPSGALWWEAGRILTVSDLHFGKSDRYARRNGALLPPYEIDDTLTRLEADIAQTDPGIVICLGDSFDDLAAQQAFSADHRTRLTTMQAGRHWIWIAGNHDPGRLDLGGTHKETHVAGPLTFRHIATAETGEISGHYHPKAAIQTRARTITRPCFLVDRDRVLLPAYGTYTGGLRCEDRALSRLMRPDAQAIVTGRKALAFPMPRYLDA